MGTVIAEIEVAGEAESAHVEPAPPVVVAAQESSAEDVDRTGVLLTNVTPVGPTGASGPITTGPQQQATDETAKRKRYSPAVLRLAEEHGVAVGAHPSFPDLNGFGRRDMNLSPEEAKNDVVYQIGALQINRFLSDARLDLKDDFSLRHFHDFLMQNGNVPIALQRWEYLDRSDEIERLDEMAEKTISITGK
ncbi:MAG: LamB/YcsF family protein [Proteobacteria bacterium]|nr:LamB/YcsF family protein [Pseudomonadota bacterium]